MKNKYPNLLLSFCCLLITYSCSDPLGQKKAPLSDSGAPAWALAEEIAAEIIVPTFPDKLFYVSDYGARADEGFDNTSAFASAIAACNKSGGGRVVVPRGIYSSGPIHLLDDVDLHLEEGAEIRFSTNPKSYLPLVHTSFEGTELMNYSPFVYAYGKRNIALTGKGILNGQAKNENWWTWKGSEDYGWKEGMPSQNDVDGRPRLIEMAEQNVPVADRQFGEGYYIRPTFVEFFDCQNVLLQGVKIIDAPFWVIHPIKSVNVTVDGVTVDSHGPNNDGCDPEYCRNVMIKNCTFNTGDDCIAIKSGRNSDGRRVAIKSERIIVRDCKMIDGHGGVVMGSEISAGVSNVFVENCQMDSPNLDRAIRIKTNTKRGGLIENVFVRNLDIGVVKEAVLKVNLKYATYNDQQGAFMPTVRNIHLENIKVKDGGAYAILANGYEASPIRNITFKNVEIEKVREAFLLEYVENLRFTNTRINGSLVEALPGEE